MCLCNTLRGARLCSWRVSNGILLCRCDLIVTLNLIMWHGSNSLSVLITNSSKLGIRIWLLCGGGLIALLNCRRRLNVIILLRLIKMPLILILLLMLLELRLLIGVWVHF